MSAIEATLVIATNFLWLSIVYVGESGATEVERIPLKCDV